MNLMTDTQTGLSFKTTKERKRLAKMLAAYLNKADVSTLLNDLLQREIDRYFPPNVQQQLLSEPKDGEITLGFPPVPDADEEEDNMPTNHHRKRK